MSSSKMSRRIKPKTFTLHVDSDTIEKLTMEAEQQGLSVNVIANRALRKYVEWDVVSERYKVASSFPSLLVKLMTWVPEEHVRELGKSQWLHEWRTASTSRSREHGIEPRLRILELFSRYGRTFLFDQVTTGSTLILTLLHGMGRKWSLFYEGMLEAMLKENIEGEIEGFSLTSTDNQVFAEISMGALKISEARRYDTFKGIQVPMSRRQQQTHRSSDRSQIA